MLDEVTVNCPYCGAVFTTLVDCSAGDQRYIEDCQVCCAPINMHLETDEQQLKALEVRRDDE